MAGDYQIGVSADGYLPATRSHVIVTANTPATIDLTLVDGGMLAHGVVSDAGGGPVAGAR